LALAAAATPVLAAEAASEAGLDVWPMVIGLVGGLALFLYGMEQMSDALKALAGDRLKDVLARLTTNRYVGAVTGAVVTAVIQSSSVTTVLTVGFITAGILSVSQAVGIIFGANIGTTLTAQIIAFKVTKFALVMIAGGFGALFLSRNDRTRQYGAMVMGLGLVFFGMSLMSDAMRPLRTYQPFLDLMVQMANPLLGILVAAAFTGLVQSSSATTGVVIAMASQGLISLEAGIALIFGANVGTCVTAMLASLGKPRSALRASLVHVLFNVLGVLLWIGLIDELARLVTWLSPVATNLSGTEKLAAECPRQIANAHTVFNIVNTLVLLPFGAQFARLVEYLIPEHDIEREVATGAAPEWTAVHLDPALIVVPSVALEQTRGELVRVGGLLRGMVNEALPAFLDNDAAVADTIEERSTMVREMAKQVDDFLIQISRRNLSEEQSEFTSQLMDVSTNLEHVESVLRKDVVPLLHRRAESPVEFAARGRAAVSSYHESVLGIMDEALTAFDHNDAERARTVVRSKPDIERELRACRALFYDLLQEEGEQAEEGPGALPLDMLDHLRRVFIYCESIAFTMLHGYLDQRGGNRSKAA
jgi:phosphate:Na+ symporter